MDEAKQSAPNSSNYKDPGKTGVSSEKVKIADRIRINSA